MHRTSSIVAVTALSRMMRRNSRCCASGMLNSTTLPYVNIDMYWLLAGSMSIVDVFLDSTGMELSPLSALTALPRSILRPTKYAAHVSYTRQRDAETRTFDGHSLAAPVLHQAGREPPERQRAQAPAEKHRTANNYCSKVRTLFVRSYFLPSRYSAYFDRKTRPNCPKRTTRYAFFQCLRLYIGSIKSTPAQEHCVNKISHLLFWISQNLIAHRATDC